MLLSHLVEGYPWVSAFLPHALALWITTSPVLRRRPLVTLLSALLVNELSWHVYELGKTVAVVFLAGTVLLRGVPLSTRAAWLVAGLLQIGEVLLDHDARTLVALQVPGPLTDDRHGDPGPAEWAALHEKRDPDGLARRRRRPAGAAGAIGVRWCLGPRRVTQRRRSGFALRGHHLTDHRRGIRHWITSFRAAGEPSGPEHPPPGGGRRLPSPSPDHRHAADHGTCVCPDRESLVECYRRRLALSIRGSGPAPLAAPPRAAR